MSSCCQANKIMRFFFPSIGAILLAGCCLKGMHAHSPVLGATSADRYKPASLKGGVINCQTNISSVWQPKVSEVGDATAALELARNYSVDGDSTNSLLWLRKAADLGNVQAQYMLGESYDAITHPEEFEGADSHDLAHMKQRGWFEASDSKEAFRWYLTAATNGHIRAMLNVGLCYARGFGTERNIEQAKVWLERMLAGLSAFPKDPIEKVDVYRCHRQLGKIYMEEEAAGDDLLAYVHFSVAKSLSVPGTLDAKNMEDYTVKVRGRLNDDEIRKAERLIRQFDRQ